MDKKNRINKISTFLAILASLCTITGITIFNDITIFELFKNIKNNKNQIDEETDDFLFDEEPRNWNNFSFTIPEETNYENVINLNNYVRLEDIYGKVFAAPTCLYTNIEYSGTASTDNILLTGSDGSSFFYSIHDLILEPPYISPQWTERKR